MQGRVFRSIVLFVAFTAGLLVPFPARALTPEQWKKDLTTLRGAIAAHPDPFRKTSKAAFDQAADALAAELPTLQEYAVVTRMAALVAMLEDGHSRLRLPIAEGAELFGHHTKTKEAKIGPFGYFSIRLLHTTDGVVVMRASREHKDLLGAQLIGIGDKSLPEVEAALRPIVAADNVGAQDYLLPSFMVVPELLRAVGIAPESDRLTWRVRLANGKEISAELAAVHDDAPLEWSALDEIAKPMPDSRHWITKLPHGLIHARLTDILADRNETIAQFADKLFGEVEATPDATLVLDLRDNPGGDNTFDDALVRGAIRAKRLWEPGRFFVLINPGTFSAASNLVTLLERWTPAIFVGEPTGGAPNCYGDPKKTVLPNSGLTAQISTLYWQVSNPKDTRDATAPLIPAAPTVASVRSRRDVAIEVVKSLLKEPISTIGTFAGKCDIEGHMLTISFEMTKDQARLSVPDLKLTNQPLQDLKRHDGTMTGKVMLGDQALLLHGRMAGDSLVGWIDFGGRPFSFAAEVASPNS